MNYQRETLVAKLREYGVTYLAPSDAVATEDLSSMDSLLMATMNQPDSRLKMALIPLFIRNPELAQRVPDLITQLDPNMALDLQTYYMAAVYFSAIGKADWGYI